MFYLHEVSADTYRDALAVARDQSVRVADATSSPEEMPDNAVYYLADDLTSGFGVSSDADLIGLFSTTKGRGQHLVNEAIGLGARTLDCFDGFLPDYYESFGFAETKREPNWAPGGPDVVYMALV
ncbi:hypothetical protein JNUCC0626_40200 [Lentzea sp. JNUCC 0626]|uniref:hypothetical protein n=1 Tax=Lentzea sp. JNUCC 0626 TaxID=3367513 RepID=UPI003749EC9C